VPVDEARAAAVHPEEPADAPPAPEADEPPPAKPAGRTEPGERGSRSGSARATQQPRSVASARPLQPTATPSVPPAQPVEWETVAGLEPVPPSEILPEQPTRDEIKRALDATRPALEACVGPAHGTTFANVTIAGSGRVIHSSIEGAFAGTPQGSCMARALRSASFPRFAADRMTVRFPFVL